MVEKIIAACSGAILLLGLSLYSLGGHAQNQQMARHEPHMSAAYGHLEQARAELDKASPNKGGHREKAIQLGPGDARSQGRRGVRSRATEVKESCRRTRKTKGEVPLGFVHS